MVIQRASQPSDPGRWSIRPKVCLESDAASP